MTTITESPIDADRESEIAKARADVMRRAEVQGVKPFTSPGDIVGDPEMTADFDVDQFLWQVQCQRSNPFSSRNRSWGQAISE